VQRTRFKFSSLLGRILADLATTGGIEFAIDFWRMADLLAE
jgi:glycine/D-amino acid oxidase-like deaminating enzyme